MSVNRVERPFPPACFHSHAESMKIKKENKKTLSMHRKK